MMMIVVMMMMMMKDANFMKKAYFL